MEGRLCKWNDERGFGFIELVGGGPEIFVHVSSFPRGGRRPQVGERLIFEIETDARGRPRAKNLVCPERGAASAAQRFHRAGVNDRRRITGSGRLGRALLVLVIAAAALHTWRDGELGLADDLGGTLREMLSSAVSRGRSLGGAGDRRELSPTAPAFRCDGRQYCSEMRSCQEAKFFLRNCPGVKMDGDHDGVPCEEQWCALGF